MARTVVCGFGLVAALMLGCLHAPVLWSPDGRWVAYTVAVRPSARSWPPAGCSGRRRRVARDGSRRVEGVAAGDRPIGSGRPGPTGESVLLEESRGPLTSPGLEPRRQGAGLRPAGPGGGRPRPVRDRAPGSPRPPASPVAPARYQEIRRQGGGPARPGASPGAPTAATWPSPRSSKTWAWRSPRGQRPGPEGHRGCVSARLVARQHEAGLRARGGCREPATARHSFGAPRRLAEIGQTSQAPVWSRDTSRSLVVARRIGPRAAEPPSQQAELLRVGVEAGKVERITHLTTEPIGRDKTFRGASFSFDRDGEDLFYTSDVEGQPRSSPWFRPRTKETFKPSTRRHRYPDRGAGRLARGKTLAMRVGGPGYGRPPRPL